MDEATRDVLVSLQEDVCEGKLAMAKRNAVLREAFEAGASQPELVAVLNDVNAAYGLGHLTTDAVFRAIKRDREATK